MKTRLFSYLFFFFSVLVGTDTLFAQNLPGKTVQISTHFTEIVGSPTWLIELRDVKTGEVFPYIFDIKNHNNHWIAFSSGHTYQIIASTITFGPYAKIKNACQIETGLCGALSGTSLGITMTGVLSPDRTQFRCRVIPYRS